MVAANQAKNRLLRILCFIVAFALLALTVAAVMIFLIPFLDESPINQGIGILFMVLLALISHVIFRRGHFRNRSTVGRRAIIAINAGLAEVL
jgi:quinol-cytochrome oxidoreductase complex cytochrome b subunit